MACMCVPGVCLCAYILTRCVTVCVCVCVCACVCVCVCVCVSVCVSVQKIMNSFCKGCGALTYRLCVAVDKYDYY